MEELSYCCFRFGGDTPERGVGESVFMNQTFVSEKTTGTPPARPVPAAPKYPGVRVTCNGNYLVSQHVETRITEGGVFYPITPSTEGGEIYQGSYAAGELNVWGQPKIAIFPLPPANDSKDFYRAC